uniref:Uncharacterized protein n=1 Tax=Candidatus Kentrum eta TaxID=2126337 RepID=A0A450VNS7_9GAMM|nr:MAG: hypothetical protein BECKH772A_GA0070896_105403 [Candidatus Kentron sp. H]VFK06462.1 MAG: hypothetical protein BECKH772B_GA0070898_106841 [Candidatus Kentron sp. H]
MFYRTTNQYVIHPTSYTPRKAGGLMVVSSPEGCQLDNLP